jgi:hypothetical protein
VALPEGMFRLTLPEVNPSMGPRKIHPRRQGFSKVSTFCRKLVSTALFHGFDTPLASLDLIMLEHRTNYSATSSPTNHSTRSGSLTHRSGMVAEERRIPSVPPAPE